MITDPKRDQEATFLDAMLGAISGSNPSDAILNQEKRGQAQLVNSDVLPTDMGDRTAYEAVGFTFGDPIPDDPMFVNATLPDGWRREGSDHAMWSYIVDPRGRQRVSIFYKAAFYDRRAHMTLNTVSGYAHECLNIYGDGGPKTPILDDSWATPDGFVTALEEYVAREEKEAASLEESLHGRTPKNAEDCRRIVVERRDYAARARAFADSIRVQS